MQIPEKLMLSCSDYTAVIIKEVFKACIIYGFRVDFKSCSVSCLKSSITNPSHPVYLEQLFVFPVFLFTSF